MALDQRIRATAQFLVGRDGQIGGGLRVSQDWRAVQCPLHHAVFQEVHVGVTEQPRMLSDKAREETSDRSAPSSKLPDRLGEPGGGASPKK